MNDITERVQAGAGYLDIREPGWWKRIDLGRLDIGDDCDCVRGQLFPHEDLPDFDPALGFEASSDAFRAVDRCLAVEAEYEALTAAWRELIQKRRAEALVPA